MMKPGLNMHSRYEILHLKRIDELNRTRGLCLQYYMNAELESGILPLVKLLNNRWSLAAHSCEGHWGSGGHIQDAYVSFFVLPNRYLEWRIIQRRFMRRMTGFISPQATVSVMECFDLPSQQPEWIRWGFGPTRPAKKKEVFGGKASHRKALDTLIRNACRVLEEELKE